MAVNLRVVGRLAQRRWGNVVRPVSIHICNIETKSNRLYFYQGLIKGTQQGKSAAVPCFSQYALSLPPTLHTKCILHTTYKLYTAHKVQTLTMHNTCTMYMAHHMLTASFTFHTKPIVLLLVDI